MDFCYRHPDRPTGVSCQRCDRAICAECVRQAPVGLHCPECQIAENAAHSTAWRTMHDNQREYALDRRAMDAQIGSIPMTGKLGAGTTVTKTLIIINVVVYLIQLVLSFFASGLLIRFGGFVALLGISEPWRFLTSGFLHSGMFHLLLNMFALYIFGQVLEPIMGRIRFATLYFASLIGGSLGMIIYSFFDPNTLGVLCVGASGAVFGLFGALFVIQRRVDASNAGLIVLLLINAAFAFIYPDIAWQAHLGGLIVGAFIMWLMLKTSTKERTRAQQRKMNWIILISSLVALMAVSLATTYAVFMMTLA